MTEPADRPLPPIGKTTLNRMLLSADSEMKKSEGSMRLQLAAGNVDDGWLKHHADRRDDFAGMVRLIEKITSDATLYELLKS